MASTPETTPAAPQTAVENSDTPYLQSLDRVLKLPVIEAALNQGAGVYEKVKGANSLFNWALSTAEATVQYALVTAAPLVQKLDGPIHMVDQQLVKGIQTIEVNVPIVTKEPQQIYETAKTAVTCVVQPTLDKIKSKTEKVTQQPIKETQSVAKNETPVIQESEQKSKVELSTVCAVKTTAEHKASSLKELSWNKANEVLATQYGQMAVSGVDSTSALAERLLDYYFPATEEDENYGDTPIAVSEDPVLHTVQTVGRLSNKAARRVYRNVSAQIKSIKPQDVKEYVASLIAVLQLTQYLQHINSKVQTNTETQTSANSSPTQKTEAKPESTEKNNS